MKDQSTAVRAIAAITLFLGAVSAGYGAATEKRTFPAGGRDTLLLDAGGGALETTGAPGEEISVEITDYEQEKCLLSFEEKKSSLTVRVRENRAWRRTEDKTRKEKREQGCRAGIKVTAPAHLKLDATTGLGSIAVNDWDGNVRLASGSGAITLHKVRGAVDARTDLGEIRGSLCAKTISARADMGAIRLDGLCSAAEVTAGMGSIDLKWERVPADGNISVNGKMGKVALWFPADAKLKTAVNASMGSKKDDFSGGEGYPVTVRSGMGAVSISKLPR